MTDAPSDEGLAQAPLGQSSAYPDHYDAGLLFPIPRAANRGKLGLDEQDELPFVGLDLWQSFELSWLDRSGKPVVRLARFGIPANSSHLIESKSFKLYLNGFNNTHFANEGEVIERLERDLSEAVRADVMVSLHRLDSADFAIATLDGDCIDDLTVAIQHYTPTPELLHADSEQIVEEVLHSHLLKSNCPVTGQPDWGSVVIRYKGPRINREGLLAYLVSYRNHQDFHEHCVERIYLDLRERTQATELAVMARYTRRGGLDINPCRASRFEALDPAWLEKRTARQ
ncbi:NADPH-dependent 7-cyano-7-deazaguanine reductase QueF [Carnimonas nigrificans]|uniref:NADPH-dependent 7-cyano-7-deazaguanine reductase QueF n=1 Tax=Carnimonas nigrificans TaxID=64323 RepID=UPI0004708A57|nr:NADPH-dependent 7-cyano-7-deazaguanine reductase QueF [Carnimonas nigrificans]